MGAYEGRAGRELGVISWEWGGRSDGGGHEWYEAMRLYRLYKGIIWRLRSCMWIQWRD